MPLPCPLDGNALEMVILDAMLPIETVAWQCASCGGVLLDTACQKVVLGQGLAVATDTPGVRSSPRTGKAMFRMDAAGIELDGCADTGAVWFDRGELLLLRQIVQRVREGKGKGDPLDDHSPVHALRVGCADCGDALDEAHAPADTSIGIVCTTCPRRLGFGAAAAGEAVTRTVERDGGSVFIEHRAASSSVVVEGIEGPFDALLEPKTLWTRMRALLGKRGDAELPAELASLYRVARTEPGQLADFLRRRGAERLLVRLGRSGSTRVELGRGRFEVRVENRAPTSSPLEVEQSVRRLLGVFLG